MPSKYRPNARCKIRGIYTGFSGWEPAKVISSVLVAFPSGLKETQVIVSHNGREVAVYPRWYEICLEGEKEPEIKPGGEKAWWDDFVLNRVVLALSVEEPGRRPYKNIFGAKKCSRVGVNAVTVNLTLLPVIFVSSSGNGTWFIEHPNAGKRDPEDVQTRLIGTTMEYYERFSGKSQDRAPSLKSRIRSASTCSTDSSLSTRSSDTAYSSSTRSSSTAYSSSIRSSDTACSMWTLSGDTVCSASTWSGATVCSSPTWSSDFGTLYEGWAHPSDSE